MTFHGYVAIQSQGVVSLPVEVRRRLHLDEPGAQVEIRERDDGVLEAVGFGGRGAWVVDVGMGPNEQSIDVDGLPGPAHCLTSSGGKGPNRTISVLLSGNRLYTVGAPTRPATR